MIPYRHTIRSAFIALAAVACAHVALADGPAHVDVALPGLARGAVLTVEQIRAAREQLQALGFDVDRCGLDAANGTIGIDIGDDGDRERLRNAGFSIVNESAAVQRAAPDLQYYDPTDIAALLQQVANDYPAITHLFSIGTTYEGRTIWALEISNHPGVAEDEPAIQFNAQHHAREVATSHVVMDVVAQLTAGYGVDQDITEWVNDYKTVCVPMVNPDGVAYVFNANSNWRKNRQLHACIGVDLNRNYPYRWGPAGCNSPSASTCTSDTYQGPSVASELETQAMSALVDTYHFVMATSYHSYGRFIDYPYACSTGAATQMPEHPIIDEIMNGMADAIDAVDSVPRYSVNSPVAIGPLSGDDTSWYYAHRGVYAMIVEVGTSFQPNYSDVAGIVKRNRGGWKYLYQRLGQARIDVHVTDACSGLPLEATVTLTEYVFDTGELPRVTFMPYGRWTFVVPQSDTYTVRASKSGYVTQDIPVPVGNEPESVAIALEKVSPPPIVFGDADCDGDVDGDDIARFTDCYTGPVQYRTAGCFNLDSNADNHVDLLDFAALQQSFP